MSPTVKGRGIIDARWRRLPEEAAEVLNLVVVEQLGDDGGDVAGWRTCGDVLAVASTVS